MKENFCVTAIVAIRNGAYYFERLCKHLRDNSITLAVIDNDSTDDLQTIVRRNSDIICNTSTLKYHGSFNLTQQLEAKQSIAKEIESDWIIHLDVDELLFSDIIGETLFDALYRVHYTGYDAINFDEFVFLPAEVGVHYQKNNYPEMCWYYFFEPRPKRLIRAFKTHLSTQVESGGHDVEGYRNLYPDNMIMRHFMFENKSHAQRKYRDRTYSDIDIENKFHGNRILLQERALALPHRHELCRADKGDWLLDTSQPRLKHFWDW